MFWADRIADQIKNTVTPRAGVGKPLLIRDEKTVSGKVHVGSMRGVAIHGALSSTLSHMGVLNEFKYEMNDFDPFDGLPLYLDKEIYGPLLGGQLYKIPSPDPSFNNFADLNAAEFEKVITDTGYYPTFYRSKDLYLSGQMDEAIRLVLTKADRIREIYKEVSGSQRVSEWLPISVICENCGKVSMTQASDFDGNTVAYTCAIDAVKWGVGCGHMGRVSPFGGRAKLPWKPEWAAKWFVLGVDVEGAGKDHSTKGGAREVANAIAKEVFNIEPPFDVPYEFFLVGGQKMASSKGRGSSARDVADLIPPKIFRLALLGKEINQAFNFDPAGETIPTLYDQYDKFADSYAEGVRDDYSRLFLLVENNLEGEPTIPFRVRFSQVAFISQMPHMDLKKEAELLKGSSLSELDLEELAERAAYAKHWLSTAAPEKYRFALYESLPPLAAELTDEQKKALSSIADLLEKNPDALVLHEQIHALKDSLGISPKELFSAVYMVFLNKKEGPKAGWFIATLDREFALKRLKEASV